MTDDDYVKTAAIMAAILYPHVLSDADRAKKLAARDACELLSLVEELVAAMKEM